MGNLNYRNVESSELVIIFLRDDDFYISKFGPCVSQSLFFLFRKCSTYINICVFEVSNFPRNQKWQICRALICARQLAPVVFRRLPSSPVVSRGLPSSPVVSLLLASGAKYVRLLWYPVVSWGLPCLSSLSSGLPWSPVVSRGHSWSLVVARGLPLWDSSVTVGPKKEGRREVGSP